MKEKHIKDADGAQRPDVQAETFRDVGGRELVFRDKIPGKLSIASPGPDGFVFTANYHNVTQMTIYLTHWLMEHSLSPELRKGE